MEKERWGGEGYLDNRAGDRSTMAAVFSIRHYLIDRVAGLIVHGGYFRAAFVWGSAILPHPSLILSSLYPTPPLELAPRPRRGPVVCVWMESRPFMFAFHQRRAKCSWLHGPGPRRDGAMGVRNPDPAEVTRGVRAPEHPPSSGDFL